MIASCEKTETIDKEEVAGLAMYSCTCPLKLSRKTSLPVAGIDNMHRLG